ncbi:MAG: class I SAM-dependent methyltransferase [Candidatus Binatia bacterium]
MSRQPVWEKVHQERAWGRYPSIELVRFVAQAYYNAAPRSAVRFVEVGCGAGANAWYLAREGFSVCGIDVSPTAIERARAYLAAEGLSADLRSGDAGEVLRAFPADHFDCVVDVGCIQCNTLADATALVGEALRVLKPGGRCFSLLHHPDSEGYGTGRKIEDGTFTDIEVGQLKGLGVNHFYTEPEARTLFGSLTDLAVDKLTHTRRNQAERYTHLLVTGRKPEVAP